MFKQSPTFSSYSIDSLPAARAFYGGTLGLEVDERPEGLALKLGGGGYLFLYPKPDHQAATFTVLNFHVPNIEEAVSALAITLTIARCEGRFARASWVLAPLVSCGGGSGQTSPAGTAAASRRKRHGRR